MVRWRGIGDHIHAAIDDHTRLVSAEIRPDELGASTTGFLLRAAAFFKAKGIGAIERIITVNAFA